MLLHPTSRIALDDIAKLLEAELHVVEVLDGLAQLNRYVGKHCLEVTEGLAGSAAAFGVDGLLRDGIIDEDHQSPIAAFCLDVELAVVFCRDEAQHFPVDVCRALLREFLADVRGDGIDVAHHHIHIGEDVVVDALQHIVRLVLFGSLNFVGVVDESLAKRLNLADGPFVGKLAHDSC